MSNLTLPTIQRMIDVLIARVIGSPLLHDLNTSAGDDLWKICNAFARRARAILVDLSAFSLNMIPRTATGAWLDRWASTCLTSGRLVATAWVGRVGFVSDPGETPVIPIGAVLTHADGTEYITTGAIAAYDWVSDEATAPAVAVTLGTVANKAVLTPLTVSAPPAHVLSTGAVVSTTTAARDAETDAELQARITNQLAGRPASGNPAHYRAWALEVPGVYDCAVYERWDGDGTVTCVPVASPGNVGVSAAIRALVLTKLNAERPINCTPTVEGLAAWAVAQVVAVTVIAKPGYEQDWTNGTDSFDVDGCSADKMTLTLGVDPTGVIEVGDRIVGFSGAGLLAEERIVDAVYPAPTNAVHVSRPFTSLVAITTTITPGGPLWQPVRDAIADVFEALGPSASSTAGKDRYPLVETGIMPPHLRLQDLYSAIGAVEGVESCLITTPASDVLNNRAATETIKIMALDEHVQIAWG